MEDEEKTAPCVQIRRFKWPTQTGQTQSVSLRGTCHYRAETTFWWNVLHFCLILHLLAWRCFYCVYVILQSSGTHRWHVMWFQAHDDKTFMSHILLAGVRQTAHKFITEILCIGKKLWGLLGRPAFKCWMVSNAFLQQKKASHCWCFLPSINFSKTKP